MLLLPAVAIGARIIEVEGAIRANLGTLKKTDDVVAMFRMVVNKLPDDARKLAFCQHMACQHRPGTHRQWVRSQRNKK